MTFPPQDTVISGACNYSFKMVYCLLFVQQFVHAGRRKEKPVNMLSKGFKGKMQKITLFYTFVFTCSSYEHFFALAIIGVRVCYAYNDLIKLHDYGLKHLYTLDNTMNFKLAYQTPSGLSIRRITSSCQQAPLDIVWHCNLQ